MAFAIRDISNEIFALSEFFDDEADYFNVPISLWQPRIDLSVPTFYHNQVNRFTLIFHIKPITNVQTLAIYRQRLVIQTIRNHHGSASRV
jgi:hypothetical protein